MKKTANGMVRCTFTSEWSDGSVVATPCSYRPATGEVTPNISKGPIPTGSLKAEFITLMDGTEIKVCRTCHDFVLKPVMIPGIGHTLNEAEECMNPLCNDEE